MKYFESTNQGEILSRITNDVDTITQTLNQSLTQIITSVTTVVGVLIMMFTINWLMTLVALLIIPLSSLVIAFIVKHSQMYFREQQDYLGHVNGHVEEVYGGHNIVKAFNGEKKSIEKFDVLNNTLYGAAWKSQFLTGIMMPLMNVIGNLGYVAVTVLGSWLVIKKCNRSGGIFRRLYSTSDLLHSLLLRLQIFPIYCNKLLPVQKEYLSFWRKKRKFQIIHSL